VHPRSNDGSDLITLLMEIQDRLSRMEEKLNSIDKDIQDLKNGLGKQQAYTDSAVGKLEEDIKDRLDKIEQKLDQLDDRVSKLEQFRASVAGASGFADKLIGFALGVLSTVVAWLMYLRR